MKKATDDLVPEYIKEQAIEIANFFRAHGIENWQLMGIENRDYKPQNQMNNELEKGNVMTDSALKVSVFQIISKWAYANDRETTEQVAQHIIDLIQLSEIRGNKEEIMKAIANANQKVSGGRVLYTTEVTETIYKAIEPYLKREQEEIRLLDTQEKLDDAELASELEFFITCEVADAYQHFQNSAQTCVKIMEKIRPYLQKREMVVRWNPIKTAPMTGRILLLWRGGYIGIGTYMVFPEAIEGKKEGWVCDQDMVIPENQEDCLYWLPLPSNQIEGGKL